MCVQVAHALLAAGFTAPTPVQAVVWAAATAGKSSITVSPTAHCVSLTGCGPRAARGKQINGLRAVFGEVRTAPATECELS